MKVAFLVGITIAALIGCKNTDSALFRPTAWATNQVPDTVILVRTQRVDVVTVTNVVGTVTTNNVLVWQTNAVVVPAHEVVKPSAWEANPATVGTVNAIGAATGPYGALGAIAVTAILGGIAQWRSKKYKDAAISLAQGIQQVSEAYPAQSKAIIETQRQVQDADGTRDTVKTVLKQVVKRPITPKA